MAVSAILCLLSILAGSGFGRQDFSALLHSDLRGVVNNYLISLLYAILDLCADEQCVALKTFSVCSGA